MTYDLANQIVSRRSDEGLRTFDYDSAGRITGEQLNGEQVAVYHYGYLDKVLSVVRGGQRTDFHYNASGMLVGKSQGGARLEPWQWDGLGLAARGDQVYLNESHVTGSTGSPQGGGAALMSRTVGGKDDQFLMTDYLGTTLGAIDAEGHHSNPQEGSEVGRANFVRTSFGDGAAAPSGGERFTGKPYDADLGAHVFPYRNYRADLGRWMSADPINFPDGPNQHHYAPVPTMGVDPLGLEEEWELVWESALPPGTAWAMVDNSMYYYPGGNTRRYTERKLDVNEWEVFGSHSFTPMDSSVTKSISFGSSSSFSIGGGTSITMSASYTQSSSGATTISLANASSEEWEGGLNNWLGKALIASVSIKQRVVVEKKIAVGIGYLIPSFSLNLPLLLGIESLQIPEPVIMKTKIALFVVSVFCPIIFVHSEVNDFVGAIVRFEASDDERIRVFVENFENESGLVLLIDSSYEIGFYANQKENEKRVDNIVPLSFGDESLKIKLEKTHPLYILDSNGLRKSLDKTMDRQENVGLQIIDWRVGKDMKFNYILAAVVESRGERQVGRNSVMSESNEDSH